MRTPSGVGNRRVIVADPGGQGFVLQKPPRVILALDGSTRVCGAALVRPGQTGTADGVVRGVSCPPCWETVGSRAEVDSRGQAKLLLPMVDEMLTEVGLSPADLGAIVVGVGPGTFTGVRIAVATARALSLALQVPVAGISTLGALAAAAATRAIAGGACRSGGDDVGVAPVSALLVPVVDARRGQVFFGLYEATGSQAPARRWVRRGAFAVCDRAALGGIVAAVGAGPTQVLAEARELIGDLPEGAEFVGSAVGAEWLVLGQDLLIEPGEGFEGHRLQRWLAGVLREGGPAVPEAVKPIYVRSPDADVHITKMRDPWAGSPGSPSSEGPVRT